MRIINTIFRTRYLYLAIIILFLSIICSNIMDEFNKFQTATTWIGVICFIYIVLFIIISLTVGLTSSLKDKEL